MRNYANHQKSEWSAPGSFLIRRLLGPAHSHDPRRQAATRSASISFRQFVTRHSSLRNQFIGSYEPAVDVDATFLLKNSKGKRKGAELLVVTVRLWLSASDCARITGISEVTVETSNHTRATVHDCYRWGIFNDDAQVGRYAVAPRRPYRQLNMSLIRRNKQLL